MNMILAIGAGGAIGAILRHFVGMLAIHWGGGNFPWNTLCVNVIGSFIMGALVAYFAHSWNPPMEVKAFLTVGVLGAFTTFSIFALDVANLWERGASMAAMGYIMASIMLSIMALFAGMTIIRQVFA